MYAGGLPSRANWGKIGLDTQAYVAVPRARGILWRIVIGLAAVLLMSAIGAWLMDAGIDRSLEAQASADTPVQSGNQPNN